MDVKHCTICNEWRNFQNFADWYLWYDNQLNHSTGIKYHIDKDVLQWNQVNKVYSPQTCCLLPRDINEALASLQFNKTTKTQYRVPLGVTRYYSGDRARYIARASTTHGYVSSESFGTQEEAFEAYKVIKSANIKELADKYYKLGAIFPNVYNALIKIDILPYGAV